MAESPNNVAPVPAPTVAAPQRFVERRVAMRRESDRLAHRETTLLARSLDLLAAPGSAEERLARLLDLLAETVGARRGAVLADGPARRVAVSRHADEDDAVAASLGAWLDARAPRSRPARAAAGPASIAVVAVPGRARPLARRRNGPATFACLPIASAGEVALGFEFERAVEPDELARRLPPQLARHAAVALALVTRQLATDRELQALRARDDERSRFVSTVAHELRTPLTGLSGYLDLMLDGKVDDPAVERDFLERGRGIVGSMGELVEDLLELSRLEAGSLGLELRPFSVAESLLRVTRTLEPIALRRGIDLAADVPSRMSVALGDRRRVEQILTNLVANAVKFAPDGSSVRLVARFDGPAAVIAVRDEGAGIEAEDRTRIFERFYRLGAHRRITGTGLGLPIARDLARAMGGELDVASVPSVGTSFVLVLPGPTAAASEPLEEPVRRALAAEEARLELAAITRTASDGGRGSIPERASAHELGGVYERRLRPIDGFVGRRTDAAPPEAAPARADAG